MKEWFEELILGGEVGFTIKDDAIEFIQYCIEERDLAVEVSCINGKWNVSINYQ